MSGQSSLVIFCVLTFFEADSEVSLTTGPDDGMVPPVVVGAAFSAGPPTPSLDQGQRNNAGWSVYEISAGSESVTLEAFVNA